MKTQFCSLEEKASFREYLIDNFDVSKSQLKKWGLSKVYLAKEVRLKDQWEVPIEVTNRGIISPSYSGTPITILEDCEAFLAVSKPFNIHCHPLRYEDSNNILSWCRANNYWEPLRINQQHYDRGLAYRLDYETSGVLILLKNELLRTWIRENYSNVSKRKVYLAIVKGEIKDGYLVHQLSSSGKKIKEEKSGQRAQISIKKLLSENSYSLIEITLFEGLRHQIRAQLSLAGCPIVGDRLYGGESASRLFLHAYCYQIETPKGNIEIKDKSLALFHSLLDLNCGLKMLGN